VNWLLHVDERRCEDNAHEAARDHRDPARDDLAPARGIAVSVLIGFAVWLIIGAAVLLDGTARTVLECALLPVVST